MTNDDIDLILSQRVQGFAAEKHLPSGFSERLVKSLRHQRRVFRLKVVTVIAVMAILGGFLGHQTLKKSSPSTETALTATETPPRDSEISGWMLFGFLRECFKRNRNHKKKEEEQ